MLKFIYFEANLFLKRCSILLNTPWLWKWYCVQDESRDQWTFSQSLDSVAQGWGSEICISTSSQVMLMLLVNFEYHCAQKVDFHLLFFVSCLWVYTQKWDSWIMNTYNHLGELKKTKLWTPNMTKKSKDKIQTPVIYFTFLVYFII
jgi:hypothetical protein